MVAKQQTAARYVVAKSGRKTSSAVARASQAKSGVLVNNKDYKEYFRSSLKNQAAVTAPLQLAKLADKVGISVIVRGGGINSQAEAVRNAIARTLVKLNESLKLPLKKAGFLTRDSRTVERKKYGLRKARRAPQWAKR
ncbi:MAG: 30S ribosomal protein S9 [Patescibacteria group bacterium]